MTDPSYGGLKSFHNVIDPAHSRSHPAFHCFPSVSTVNTLSSMMLCGCLVTSVENFISSSHSVPARLLLSGYQLCPCNSQQLWDNKINFPTMVNAYTGWPKKVNHYQMIKTRIKSY